MLTVEGSGKTSLRREGLKKSVIVGGECEEEGHSRHVDGESQYLGQSHVCNSHLNDESESRDKLRYALDLSVIIQNENYNTFTAHHAGRLFVKFKSV